MLSLSRLAVPIGEVPITPEITQNPQRPKKGRFLKGPVDWDWLTIAARLPGRALHLAIAISYLNGFDLDGTVRLKPSVVRELGLDRHASYRALKELEDAGVISVVRGRGKAPVITIRDPHKN